MGTKGDRNVEAEDLKARLRAAGFPNEVIPFLADLRTQQTKPGYIPYASNDLTVKHAIATLVRLHGKVKQTRAIVDKVLGVIDLYDLVTIGLDLSAKPTKPVRRVRKVI